MENSTQDKESRPASEDAAVTEDVNSTPAGDEAADEAVDEVAKLTREVEELKGKLEKEKKEYMFLMADFDNYRKHTLKEKSEMIRNGGEKVFKELLPIADDMERAIKHGSESNDPKALQEGMELIFKKLKGMMEKNGVKEMKTNGEPFDADKHEAISVVPVPEEDKKGRILDTVNTGYTMNDKVLRHAKVVVGQ